MRVSGSAVVGSHDALADRVIDEQRRYFELSFTTSPESRLAALDRLFDAVRAREEEILAALAEDLGKPPVEAYSSEIGVLLQEIRYIRRRVKRWMKPVRVRSPLILAVSSSRIVPEPFGVSLIISPWNYPFLLAMAPLVGALAAGNTAVLKPSELSPATSRVIARLIHATFPAGHVRVVEGGREVATALLERRFDRIFYTGSARVGRIVLEKAARFLTPVTLELGGKSPCIVTGTADIAVAARRIASGKFLNAGQTCVAPDYCIVHESVYERFLEALRAVITELYGDNTASSPDYARIVNRMHTDRVAGLIDPERVVVGGRVERTECRIAPTVMRDVDWDHPSMQEEIFGPVLPVLRYHHEEELFGAIRERSRPLALYVFSEDRRVARRILSRIPSGSGCVNDTVIHLASVTLPFGGVGESGMGRYRGKASFDAFSYQRSIVDHRSRPDVRLRYPPYRRSLRLYRRLIG